MKRIIPTLIFLTCCISSFSQNVTDSVRLKWKKSFESGLNVNQASFSDNWTGGGINSIALGTFLNGRILYEGNKFSFDNTLQLMYGFLKNKGQDFRKNTDRVFADSKLGYKISSKWNTFVSVNFLSQFAPGYQFAEDGNGNEQAVLISRFLAPGYLTTSAGFEYKPADHFWIRFGIGGLRQTFVLDTSLYHVIPENYGVPVHKKVRNEMAFVVTANYDREIAKNLHLKVLLTAFSNYENMAATDVRSDIVLTAKVNKFINVNLTGAILYDQDQDYEVQYSQGLALGIVYTFSQFEPKK